MRNGGVESYPQSMGGVVDANPLPEGSYSSVWTACNEGNDYCGTGNSVAEHRDENTGVVWSARISTNATWFIAHNCKYPNELPGDDGICDVGQEVACVCVKRTEDKTGCEALEGGGWRLPHQKELLLAYIDGSAGVLSNATTAQYWTSTVAVNGVDARTALSLSLLTGTGEFTIKTVTARPTRCVWSENEAS